MAVLEILLMRTMLAAAWLGPWLLLLLLVGAVLAGRWLGKRQTGEKGIWLRATGVLVAVVQVFAVAGLVMSFGPGREIVRELRLLHRQSEASMPELGFRRVDDDAETNLASLRGQVVLLNVWATWCPPCRAEMPALEEVQKRLGSRGLVVATLSDEERETLQAYFAEHPMEAAHFYNRALPPYLASTARPKSLLIDRQGVLRDFVLGAHDAEFFTSWVEPLLD